MVRGMFPTKKSPFFCLSAEKRNCSSELRHDVSLSLSNSNINLCILADVDLLSFSGGVFVCVCIVVRQSMIVCAHICCMYSLTLGGSSL